MTKQSIISVNQYSMELIRQKLIYSIFVLKNISWIPFDIIQVIIMFAYPKISVILPKKKIDKIND